MNERIFVSTLIILSLIIILSGCTSGPEITGSAVMQKSAKIGVLLPLTGDAAPYGENVKNAIELAKKDLGFEVVYEDSKCNGPDAVPAVRKLIDVDNVDVIIGQLCDVDTLAASPIANEVGILMIGTDSTSLDLTNTETIIGKQFVKKYSEAYNSVPTMFAAEAYDAIIAAGEAARASDGSRVGIIEAMKDVKFKGASGLVDFGETAVFVV